MKFVNLTSKEFEIMKIFWQYDKPLTAAEIMKLAPEKTWSFNSLYPLVNQLLKKQYIKVAGNVRTVKAPSRVFTANISLLEYSNMQFQSIFTDSDKKINIGNMLSYFCNHSKNSDALIKEIEEWIEEH